MKDILTDLEIVKIEAFCADKEMYEAVRKVLLQGIYSHGVMVRGLTHNPLRNGALNLAALAVENPIPDEILGQNVRGMWAGLNAMENAFKTLDTIKSEINKPVLSEYNEAE